MGVKIISFMSRKGGVGKSTLSVLTATSLFYRTGKKILLLDADPQWSVFNLRQQEKEDIIENQSTYDVMSFDWRKKHNGDVPMRRFLNLIPKIEKNYDIVVIDTPGKMEGDEIPVIAGISDFIIVPIVGSAFDIQSTIDFLNIIPEISNEKKEMDGKGITVYGLVNKYDRSLEFDYLKDIEGVGGLKMLNSHLSQRVRYKRENSTIKELVSEHRKNDEFNDYMNELISNFKISKNGIKK